MDGWTEGWIDGWMDAAVSLLKTQWVTVTREAVTYGEEVEGK